MANTASWLAALITSASGLFALPLLLSAGFFSALSFMTGNREAGKTWLIYGLIGFAIMTGLGVIASSIPKVS